LAVSSILSEDAGKEFQRVTERMIEE
jgi:hypothetical protein